jgi:hypothetical protein
MSKRVALKYGDNRKFLINCERNFYELKFNSDDEERDAWQITEGYNSTQTAVSNYYAATKTLQAILEWYAGRNKRYKILPLSSDRSNIEYRNAVPLWVQHQKVRLIEEGTR